MLVLAFFWLRHSTTRSSAYLTTFHPHFVRARPRLWRQMFASKGETTPPLRRPRALVGQVAFAHDSSCKTRTGPFRFTAFHASFGLRRSNSLPRPLLTSPSIRYQHTALFLLRYLLPFGPGPHEISQDYLRSCSAPSRLYSCPCLAGGSARYLPPGAHCRAGVTVYELGDRGDLNSLVT